ncbi:hypothetical protein TW83_19110, partial [Paracoccus sp. S4493]|uniref:hypothetical protein n=1 Tax=Paracoccus sp. S4493 TaxID=579490 RepID=UPI0005F9F9F9
LAALLGATELAAGLAVAIATFALWAIPCRGRILGLTVARGAIAARAAALALRAITLGTLGLAAVPLRATVAARLG